MRFPEFFLGLPQRAAALSALSPLSRLYIDFTQGEGVGLKGVGRWFVLLCFFFSSLKFILSLLSYFPPTRDLPTSYPAQPLTGKRGCTPRGFLGEPPPAARTRSPGSPRAQLQFPAALTPAPRRPGSPRMMRKRLRPGADAARRAAAGAALPAFAGGSTLRGAPCRPRCAPGPGTLRLKSHKALGRTQS